MYICIYIYINACNFIYYIIHLKIIHVLIYQFFQVKFQQLILYIHNLCESTKFHFLKSCFPYFYIYIYYVVSLNLKIKFISLILFSLNLIYI